MQTGAVELRMKPTLAPKFTLADIIRKASELLRIRTQTIKRSLKKKLTCMWSVAAVICYMFVVAVFIWQKSQVSHVTDVKFPNFLPCVNINFVIR